MPPPTTIRAPASSVPSFEQEQPRQWSVGTGAAILIGAALLIAGGIIAALIIYKTGGIAVAPPNNSRLAGLSPSPTPTARTTPKPTPEPTPTPIPLPTATPALVQRVRATPPSEGVYEESNNEPKPTPRAPDGPRVTLLNENFFIPHGAVWSRRFHLNRTAHVFGGWIASTPIEVYITGPNGPVFTSSRSSSGKIDFIAGEGNYEIIFSNAFSWFTNKNVHGWLFVE